MGDWRARVRERIAGADLSPTTEMSVVDELAQHVEDRFRTLSEEGLDEQTATELSLRELDGTELAAELRSILPKG
jgi:hypothetical protein